MRIEASEKDARESVRTKEVVESIFKVIANEQRPRDELWSTVSHILFICPITRGIGEASDRQLLADCAVINP